MLSVIIILTKLNFCRASHCHPRTGQWDAYIKSMYKPLYITGGSADNLGEVLVTYVKLRKSCRMSCDVGETTEGLKNELWRRWRDQRSLQHEISRIGTFILVIKSFLYQNKWFSIWFCHGEMRRTGGTIRRTVRLVTPPCRHVDILVPWSIHSRKYYVTQHRNLQECVLNSMV